MVSKKVALSIAALASFLVTLMASSVNITSARISFTIFAVLCAAGIFASYARGRIPIAPVR